MASESGRHPGATGARLWIAVVGVLVGVGLIATIVGIAAHLKRRERVTRLERTSLPVYPSATELKRTVDSRIPILIVQYQVAVPYPSKAVLAFYDTELLADGWVRSSEEERAMGDRE